MITTNKYGLNQTEYKQGQKTMKHFKYYLIVNHDDNSCFSLISKTKKDVLKQFNELEYAVKLGLTESNYDVYSRKKTYTVHRIAIPYTDMFNLFDSATDENGSRAMTAYSEKTWTYTLNRP